MTTPTKERLIDKLRDELYKKHNWTGETAVNYMVPIILAIRHKDDEADPDAILGALEELRERGKRELEDTLNAVKAQYQDVSPLLSKTLDKMIGAVNDLPDGIIYDVLDYLHRNQLVLRSFRDEDFIGTLFERSVSDAFRGDDGRFFTPRNIILIVREMMQLLESKHYPRRSVSDLTVCDPCCGSARFLIYWSEFITREIREKEHLVQHTAVRKRLKEIATQNLFGADIHSETAAYGCLNMMLHGDGATNIANLDSLDHFGFFADMPLLREFAQEFQEKWENYCQQPGVSNAADLQPYIETIEAKREVVAYLLDTGKIDLSDPKWLDVMSIIRALLEVDRGYATEWDTIRAIQRRRKRRAIHEAMLNEWARRNPDVANGFDVIITNPPFGRQADLMVDDVFILSQYRLATELWIPDMYKGRTEDLLSRTLAKDEGLAIYYIELLDKHFGKEYVEAVDEVHFSKLAPELLETLLEHHGIALEAYVTDLATRIRKHLRRVVSEQIKQERKLLDKSDSDYKKQDKALRKAAQDERNRINNLLLDELKEEMLEQGLDWTDILSKRELVAILTKALDRAFVEEDDDMHLNQLPPRETLRVCAEYLYEGGKPGEALTGEIIAYFGKEWLTVEDIEGPDGYTSKVTIVFNREPHTIYYDDVGQPIVYKSPLPKQVLFIEQFLRMVKPGGKVFTVLDTGVLSNVGDEFVRQFIYRHARVHAIVEFPHGAFKAAEANVRTAIVLMERSVDLPSDYRIFGALPKYLGFMLNKQDVPPIPENDLGKVACDFADWLGLSRLCPSEEECVWHISRKCRFWEELEEKSQ